MNLSGKYYLACLWPGLPELWLRGQVSALPTAITFTFVANFLLIARLRYPEWLTPLLVKFSCWLAVAIWVICVAKAIRRLPILVAPRSVSDRPDRFSEAHAQYLAGHWPQAEALLVECLDVEPRDPPALLLLCGVYRHTGRLQAASDLLEQLQRMERADHWWLEMDTENRRLQRFIETAAAHPAPPENDQDDPRKTDHAAATDSVLTAELAT